MDILKSEGNNKISFEEFRNFAGSFSGNHWEFAESIGIENMTEDKWLNAWNNHKDKDELFDGTLDILNRLKEEGFNLGIVTTSSWERLNHVIDMHNMRPIFQHIVTTMDDLKPKPDPEGLLLFANKLGVDPLECIYIGDAEIDVLAAKAAGMKTIAVTWGTHPKERFEKLDADAKPDYIVTSFEELYNVISSLKSNF